MSNTRRRASSVRNRLAIALTITWCRITRRRWYIEYDGAEWTILTD